MLSVSMVLPAFELRTARGNENQPDLDKNIGWEDVIIDIPIKIQTPPPPKIIAPKIEVIDDDVPVEKTA